MKTSLSLHDYDVNDFPSLARQVLMREVKLVALITAKDWTTFFVPENEYQNVKQAENLIDSHMSFSDPKSSYPAKSGKYEILDHEFIADALDSIYAFETNPNLRKISGDPDTLQIQKSISPEGESGFLVEMMWTANGDRKVGGATVTLSRILVEILSSPISTLQFSNKSHKKSAAIEGRDGDPLAHELSEYVTKYGLESLNADSFLAFIEGNVSFDPSHGTVQFQLFNGAVKDVNRRALNARIRRLRNR